MEVTGTTDDAPKLLMCCNQFHVCNSIVLNAKIQISKHAAV